jgi:hypothetical protein
MQLTKLNGLVHWRPLVKGGSTYIAVVFRNPIPQYIRLKNSKLAAELRRPKFWSDVFACDTMHLAQFPSSIVRFEVEIDR